MKTTCVNLRKIALPVLLFSLLSLPACQDEGTSALVQTNEYTLEATMGGGSRTQADENGTVTWSKGDRMLVYGENVEGVLTLQGDGGETTGTFNGFVSGSPDNLQWSIYPAEGSRVVPEGAEITLSQITYPFSNSPMVGKIGKDKNVNLHHLCSLLRIPFENVPAGAEMTISCPNIAGTAVWNGEELKVTQPEGSINVTLPVGGDLIVDVPVFATSTKTEKTFTLTIGGASCIFKSPIGIGKLSKNDKLVFKCIVVGGKVTDITPEKRTGITISKEDEPMTEDDEEYLITLD